MRTLIARADLADLGMRPPKAANGETKALRRGRTGRKRAPNGSPRAPMAPERIPGPLKTLL
eukprot:5141164-Pyramimonas_sp.AAC.1